MLVPLIISDGSRVEIILYIKITPMQTMNCSPPKVMVVSLLKTVIMPVQIKLITNEINARIKVTIADILVDRCHGIPHILYIA